MVTISIRDQDHVDILVVDPYRITVSYQTGDVSATTTVLLCDIDKKFSSNKY